MERRLLELLLLLLLLLQLLRFADCACFAAFFQRISCASCCALAVIWKRVYTLPSSLTHVEFETTQWSGAAGFHPRRISAAIVASAGPLVLLIALPSMISPTANAQVLLVSFLSVTSSFAQLIAHMSSCSHNKIKAWIGNRAEKPSD